MSTNGVNCSRYRPITRPLEGEEKKSRRPTLSNAPNEPRGAALFAARELLLLTRSIRGRSIMSRHLPLGAFLRWNCRRQLRRHFLRWRGHVISLESFPSFTGIVLERGPFRAPIPRGWKFEGNAVGELRPFCGLWVFLLLTWDWILGIGCLNFFVYNYDMSSFCFCKIWKVKRKMKNWEKKIKITIRVFCFPRQGIFLMKIRF